MKKSKFLKRSALLNYVSDGTLEIFELVAPSGQSVLISDSYDDVLEFLRSDSASPQSAS